MTSSEAKTPHRDLRPWTIPVVLLGIIGLLTQRDNPVAQLLNVAFWGYTLYVVRTHHTQGLSRLGKFLFGAQLLLIALAMFLVLALLFVHLLGGTPIRG